MEDSGGMPIVLYCTYAGVECLSLTVHYHFLAALRTQCQDLLTLPPVTCSKVLSAKFQLTVLYNTCQVLVYVSLLTLRCHFPFQCNVKYKQWGDCTNGLKSDDHAPDCIWASNSFGDTGTYILRQVLRFTLRASGLGTPAHTLDLKFNLADQVVQHCMVHIWKPVFEEYG